MSLMKLFNKSYFKENLKKSKGILAFFFGVVPLLNVILLIAFINDAKYSGTVVIANMNMISLITCLGLYIIPLIFAISLFGFVFKQKSVDFVMSKPISRKSLYFTNIIGGILVLALYMMVNAIIFRLFGLIFESLIIPFGLIIDYFISLLVANIFMFSICVLAITLAGNFMSSGVIILLILFLYPFFLGLNTYYLNNESYIRCTEEACRPTNYVCRGYGNCESKLLDNYYELTFSKNVRDKLTLPVSFFVNQEDSFSYNSYGIIKMLILSVVYLGIGAYVFKNRKMENNETSFKSEFAHYLVKTLTMLPISFLFYLALKEGDFIFIIVDIAGTLIYYIIYDIITRKEIYKFIKSIIICFITMFVFSGIYYLYYDIGRANNYVLLNDVDKIEIDYNGQVLVIDDKSIIKAIIKENLSLLSDNYYSYKRYNSTLVNNMTKYEAYLIINDNLLNTIYNKTEQSLKSKFNFNKINYVEYNREYIPLTEELKSLIKEASKEVSLSSETLKVYRYQNHKYERIDIDLNNNEALKSYLLKYINNKVVEFLSSVDYIDLYFENISSTDVDYDFFDSEVYLFEYVINANLNSFISYLQNSNDKITDKTLRIGLYTNRNYMFITIYDAEAFKKEYETYKENVKDTEEYQRLIKELEEEDYEY